jgi:hypothetical protein
MSDDAISLPADLASHNRVLCRGTWLSELREDVALDDHTSGVLREIWIRLPSGQDKRWRTNERVFGALPGHQVGALIGITRQNRQRLIGMANFNTGECRLFYYHKPAIGLGCLIWVGLFICVGGVTSTGTFAIWLLAFLGLAVASIYNVRSDAREEKQDCRRLDYLFAAGPASPLEETPTKQEIEES